MTLKGSDYIMEITFAGQKKTTPGQIGILDSRMFKEKTEDHILGALQSFGIRLI